MSNETIGNAGSSPDTTSTGTNTTATPQAPASSVQDANSNATNTSVSNAQNVTPNVTSDNDIKSMREKISALERERNDYSKKYSEVKPKAESQDKVIAGLNRLFKKDKNAFEEFKTYWKDTTGEQLKDYNELYGTPETQSDKSGTQQQQTTQQINPVEITKQVREQMRLDDEKKAFETASIAFIKSRDDINHEKLSDKTQDDKDKAALKYSYLSNAAMIYKSHHPSASWEDSYQNASFSDPDIRSQMEARAQQTGEKIARASTINSGVGVNRAPTGDTGGGEANMKSYLDKLTSEQKAHYEMHLKKGNVEFAQKYAKRVAESN